jgi:RNA polymerase sigma-70 factor (ECF subfamily)
MSRSSANATAPMADAEVVAALRARDEAAFVALVRTHHSLLHRTAMTYVSSRAVAEEVVQETWVAVLAGLERFEGRSSLRTWIFHIAANIARTRGAREARCRPFSSMAGAERGAAAIRPGHWASAPDASATPEARLLSRETQGEIRAAIDALPPTQRLVVLLRDVEGWSANDACDALGLTPGNQRVLLHRARAQVCAALEGRLRPADAAA